MKSVVIVGAKRSAIGSFGGSLKDVLASDLASIVLNGVLEEMHLEPHYVDEVILGHVLSAGLGQNVARQVALKSGLRESSSAFCVNHVCGSGLKALQLAYQSIVSGASEVVVAGGVENMSQAPYVLKGSRWGYKMGHQTLTDTLLHDGLWCAMNDYHMGITAENLADRYQVSREEQDQFAFNSQKKAIKARKEGRFKQEIVPINIASKKGDKWFLEDEYIKEEANLDALAKLKPAFKKDGSVTAGNASGINDGAAILVLMSEERAKALGLNVIAKIESFATVGVDPSVMGIGPVEAVKKALSIANVSLKDIDLIEANEAFAVQSLCVGKELGFDADKLNVNGGAIALGHPIGASGARIAVTLLHEMIKRESKYGLATLCVGGGQGIAAIFKRGQI